jgi:hypothetical protein
MPDKHITLQPYTASDAVSYGASVVERHLCEGATSHFIAVLLCVGIGLSLLTAWTAYVAGGAEDVVYRHAALIKASVPVHAGWER